MKYILFILLFSAVSAKAQQKSTAFYAEHGTGLTVNVEDTVKKTDTSRILYVAIDTSTQLIMAKVDGKSVHTRVVSRPEAIWFYGYRVKIGKKNYYVDETFRQIPKQYIIIRRIIL